MKLKLFKRTAETKGQTEQLRRDGFIPGIIYHRGKDSEKVYIVAEEYTTHLRSVKSGHLPTTVFTLVDEKGKERKAILKEITYHPVSYSVIHVDFEELHSDAPITVKVPIELTSVVDCIGVKLGGMLRQVIRHVKVRCLPKDIPSAFFLDVKNLELNQSKRLQDLDIPQAVKPVANLNEVAVLVAKR